LFEGKDDASKNTAAAVDNVAISSKLESKDFVAIKLDSGSEAYRQFAQICILFVKYVKVLLIEV
jgi:5-methylcytosine-specific restriction endonuclease McrBC regulatory subunit McrC